jgi:hypothetical protein
MKCWICGAEGTTGEHTTKRSDLRSVFGMTTQAVPLYYHDGNRKNQLIRSLDSRIMKFPNKICSYCNNTRTQPHDRGWERMSEWLRSRNPPIRPGAIVRARGIFPNNTSRGMLNVHLYYVKQFGCLIQHAALIGKAILVDLSTFASAIMSERAHPSVYIMFGCGRLFRGHPMTGRSNLRVGIRDGESCVYAAWDYYVDGVGARVIFAAPDVNFPALERAWHPRFGTNRLVIGDLQ